MTLKLGSILNHCREQTKVDARHYYRRKVVENEVAEGAELVLQEVCSQLHSNCGCDEDKRNDKDDHGDEDASRQGAQLGFVKVVPDQVVWELSLCYSKLIVTINFLDYRVNVLFVFVPGS